MSGASRAPLDIVQVSSSICEVRIDARHHLLLRLAPIHGSSDGDGDGDGGCGGGAGNPHLGMCRLVGLLLQRSIRRRQRASFSRIEQTFSNSWAQQKVLNHRRPKRHKGEGEAAGAAGAAGAVAVDVVEAGAAAAGAVAPPLATVVASLSHLLFQEEVSCGLSELATERSDRGRNAKKAAVWTVRWVDVRAGETSMALVLRRTEADSTASGAAGETVAAKVVVRGSNCIGVIGTAVQGAAEGAARVPCPTFPDFESVGEACAALSTLME